MKQIILFALAFYILFFSSCSIAKKKIEEDKSTLTTETEKRFITREPSKVINETKYNVKYKDTTIVTTNYETRTILREVYNKKGDRTTECICDGIREELELVKSVLQNDISKEKETTHSIDIAPLIWAFSGFLGVLVLLGIIGLVIYYKAQKALPELINRALKE
jgi:hypothetical protein